MRAIRRTDLTPRVEMLPLIDVVFLLLTFFIYSLILMVRADILPVELASVGTGEAARASVAHALTIDEHGALFYNRKPLELPALDVLLAELAARDEPMRLYIAVAAQGKVDRAELLVELLHRVSAAGIDDVAIVGQPDGGGGP